MGRSAKLYVPSVPARCHLLIRKYPEENENGALLEDEYDIQDTSDSASRLPRFLAYDGVPSVAIGRSKAKYRRVAADKVVGSVGKENQRR